MEKVEVDFTKKTADVTMQPDKRLSQDACAQAFKGTRYAVTSFAETQ